MGQPQHTAKINIAVADPTLSNESNYTISYTGDPNGFNECVIEAGGVPTTVAKGQTKAFPIDPSRDYFFCLQNGSAWHSCHGGYKKDDPYGVTLKEDSGIQAICDSKNHVVLQVDGAVVCRFSKPVNKFTKHGEDGIPCK